MVVRGLEDMLCLMFCKKEAQNHSLKKHGMTLNPCLAFLPCELRPEVRKWSLGNAE